MHIYRVLIVYDIEGWAYHHNAMALQKFAPPDFHVTVSSSYDKLLQNERFDLILFLPFTHVDKLRTACNSMSVPPLIISVFSVGWGYANDWLEEARSHSDGVIISSYRMWDQSGRLPDTWYVPSGADFDIFNVTEPIEARQPRVLWFPLPSQDQGLR